jgi:hypothetical protein
VTNGEPLAELVRWETAGGTWQLVATRGEEVTIALCRCDGGEEVGRITSADHDLIAYVTATADEL